MGASFEEKSVWIMLLGLVLTFGLYFLAAGLLLAQGVTAVPAYAPFLIGAVVLLILISIAGHVVVALTARADGADERDRLISWRAEHNASWVLGAGAFAAVVALALPVERVWIANGLLLALFLSEVLKHVLQLVYYRRGM